MTPYEIRGYLLVKGYTLSRIASESGVSTACVSQVIKGRFTSPKIMNKIAEILGKKTATIFPSISSAVVSQGNPPRPSE